MMLLNPGGKQSMPSADAQRNAGSLSAKSGEITGLIDLWRASISADRRMQFGSG